MAGTSIVSRAAGARNGHGREEPALAGRLAHMPAREKLERLVASVRGKKRALVLTHDNPDPDSIAAAVALADVLHRYAKLEARVGYGGIIGRAENLAFVKVLKLPIAPIAQIELEDHDCLAMVDTQPSVRNHALPPKYRADIVIDHHPLREETLEVPFADVGGDFGATSTMLVEYLRAARLEPSVELATALFYGIKADTRDLDRLTTKTDVDCYVWLLPRIDRRLLSHIEHPELPMRYFRLYHKAVERAKVYGGQAVVTDLGEVYSPDMVAEVAERMVFLEGAKWSLASGSYRSQLYFSIRTNDRRMNAGRLIREICEDQGGSSGGHGSMAGARIPLSGPKAQRDALKRTIVRRFLESFGLQGVRPVSILSAEE